MAIISNSNSSLHGIDLSHNLIEDRGTHTLDVCYFAFLFLAVLTILFIYLFFHFLDLILFSLSCTIYMPCMQALLAYAVSWPKLDKVKDFLDKPLCGLLLVVPNSLLEFVVENNVYRASRLFYTWLCLCSFFVWLKNGMSFWYTMTHSIQVHLIYALPDSRFTGATHLSSSLSKAHRGLVKLSLSHCGLTGKGVVQIGHALVLNKCMASSLQHLDLSNNVAKDDINVRKQVVNQYALYNDRANFFPFYRRFVAFLPNRMCWHF